jgi:selenocysteine lyase/cysteine desulfurase
MNTDFKIETNGIYLAACSHSPFYKQMRTSLRKYEDDLIEFGNPWDLWTEKVNESKVLFARIINANRDEISPHFSVSSAFGSLLSCFNYTERNEIISSDLEYPTTNHIILAQNKYGAKQVLLKNVNYRLTMEQYISSACKKTKLLTAIHVSSLNGFMQDLHAISEIARTAGSKIYVDAYQSAGNTPIDVKKDDIDYLTAGTLKYLLGLPGLAFLYVRKELIEEMEPSFIGWFSQKNPFGFGSEKLDFTKNADRFQSGTWAVPSIYAGIIGMKTILSIGVDIIRARIERLTERAIKKGEEYGLETITPKEVKERGAIVSFIVPNAHELEGKLRSSKIFTSSRNVGLRLAPHFYNTSDEIDSAVETISSLTRKTA